MRLSNTFYFTTVYFCSTDLFAIYAPCIRGGGLVRMHNHYHYQYHHHCHYTCNTKCRIVKETHNTMLTNSILPFPKGLIHKQFGLFGNVQFDVLSSRGSCCQVSLLKLGAALQDLHKEAASCNNITKKMKHD